MPAFMKRGFDPESQFVRMEKNGSRQMEQRTAGSGKVIAGILVSAFAFATMEAVLKLAAAGLDSMQLTAVRFFIGGLILLPFGLAAKNAIKSCSRSKTISGFCCSGWSVSRSA